MSRSIQTVTKWLPIEIKEFDGVFKDARDLRKTALELLARISTLLESLQRRHSTKMYHCISTQNELQFQEMDDISLTIKSVATDFNALFQNLHCDDHCTLIVDKVDMWKTLLWQIKLKIVFTIQALISEIAYLFIYYGENYLSLTLKISTAYNQLLWMDSKYGIANNISVCNNTCPYLIFPLRKMSVTKLLQIMANNRAELCCHKLIDCLLETYKIYDDNEDNDNGSDNSSLEIYRALTKHMSPPEPPPPQPLSPNPDTKVDILEIADDTVARDPFLSIQELIACEEKNVVALLAVIVKVAPEMLGNDCIKHSRSTGAKKIGSQARDKVLDYYEQILWGEVGNFLEHVILWWTASPLSARPPHSSQHLREWITQFIPTADVPPVIASALSSLADGLGVHITSTSWDQHFRLALVAAKKTCNAETGRLFCSVLQDLTVLCNQCEVTPEWIVGAPLDELPLVEQIPALHRLDHSIHTTRLWAVNETKKLANNWNVDAFFAVTHADIVSCLAQLNTLKFADHSVELDKGGLDVHVQVCALMRAKLVSEVNGNTGKLKETPHECVQGLAKVCRTISLANLQMIYPDSSYWRQVGKEPPDKPTPYVDKYLDHILTPVLAATSDHVISNMILQIMCESWLDHIYTNRIKFSANGARQLLCDFGRVATWLTHCCPSINATMRNKMLKNEVLRRCEGVGRLLLRCPGEQIKMVDKSAKAAPIKDKEKSPDSSEKGAESMPAEMYVPNQEKWLELRAIKKRNLFTTSLCCGKL